MGRGRAKAKQTKVARQLKYNSPEMDLDSLQRELASQHSSNDEDDQYSEYADYGADDWDSDEWNEDDFDER